MPAAAGRLSQARAEDNGVVVQEPGRVDGIRSRSAPVARRAGGSPGGGWPAGPVRGARSSHLAGTVDARGAATPLAAPTRQLLEQYLDLLYRAALELNLTRIPRQDAWDRHVLESLALLEARSWRAGERVLDLGSGGGVPGIPLAIVRPDLDLVLLEKSPRKAEYLGAVVRALRLDRVVVVAAAARGGGPPPVAPAAVVISRAAAGPPEVLRLAMPLLSPGGELWAHVGRSAEVDGPLRAAARSAGATRPVIRSVPPVRLLDARRQARPGGSPPQEPAEGPGRPVRRRPGAAA